MKQSRWGTLRASLTGLFWLGAMLLSATPYGAYASPQKLGDLDEDTAPTVLDIVRIVNHFTGVVRLNSNLEPFADVDQDGAVNEADAALVGKAILNLRPLPDVPLARVRETSPAHGEGSVAVTRETILRLNFPLSTNAVVSNSNLFAQFGGRRILSRVELSPDRRTVTLFYQEPLPPAARIRVTFNGPGITDFLGRPIDPDGDGVAGGNLIVDFDTLNLAIVAGTVVSGRVFASELAQGDAGQSVNVPLAGVTITVDGQEQTMRAVTDQFGNFRLDPAPAGEFFVHVDGRTASNFNPTNAYYPFVGKKWQSIAGEEVVIGNIYLPLIAEGSLVSVSSSNDTVITFPDFVLAEHPELQGVTITIPTNSLYSDGGVRGGRVGIAPVAPDRLPEPLPPGLEFPLVITVQTDGPSNFDRPVPVCFPNLPDPRTGQIKAPGDKSALWSFNHDIGRWEVVGSMTVSADGRLVCSDPGMGIRQPGWHGVQDGTAGSGGPTQTRDPRDPTEPDPTAPQECAQNDEDACCGCKSEDSVLLHSGEERLQRVDLSIPGRGDLHFEMRRWYRSRLNYNGPLGHGWSFTYAEGLYFEGNGDITRANGHAHVDRWVQRADGSFEAPHGNFRALLRNPDGTVVLREPDGMRRYYRSDGRLFSQEDRFGNRMLFDYDAVGNLARVIDVYGREIDFFFQSFPDGVDRLVRIRDFVGREVLYTYDERGDLISVRSPVVVDTSTGNDVPQGRSERYSYSSGFVHPDLNHNLLSITLPEEVANGGPPAMRWTYGNNPSDALTFDKVLAETIGGTNASGIGAGGTRSFTYTAVNESEPPGNHDLPRLQVTVTERNGNVAQYFINEHNENIITRQLTRGLRPGEPTYYETRSYYNEEGLILRRLFPEGNQVVFSYDDAGPRHSQQNLIEQRRVADPARGGGEDIVTRYTYEPLFNQVASITEARGNATGFVPPVGVASANRYTMRFYFDYQESTNRIELAELFGIDLSSVPRGLGDLNGDGRTDQAYGNAVRIERPTVLLRDESRQAARLGSTQQRIIRQIQWNDRGQRVADIDAEGDVTEHSYYPANDPDGDGTTTFSPYVALGNGLIGYLAAIVADARVSPRRTSTVAPAALETRFAYDLVGNMVSILDPRGILTTRELNSLNEVVRTVRGADVSGAISRGTLLTGETPYRFERRFSYDHNGRVVLRQIENRDGNTAGVGAWIDRRIDYDILGNTVRVSVEVDAATTLTTEYRYDADENATLIRQPQGNATAFTYDERNRVHTTTRGVGTPEASTTRVDYDRNGNRLRVVDAEDNDGDGTPESTLYVYDGFNRVAEVVDHLGNHTVNTYDVAYNLIRTRLFGHPAGQPTGAPVLHSDVHYRYDELNRRYQTDRALFVSTGSNPSRTPVLPDHNSDGFVSTFEEFDALDRLTYDIEDDGQISERIYDGAARLVQTIDAAGNNVMMEYDRNNNPTKATKLEGATASIVPNEVFVAHYVYDQLNRLVRATDNAGRTTRFLYDSRDNLILVSDPEGPPTADPLGLFPGPINGPGNTRSFSYDGMGRLLAQYTDLRVGGTGSGSVDTTNPFNADGRVTLRNVWDGNSRLVATIDDNGNTTSFEYDSLDRRIRLINADEVTTWAYDRDSNLRQVVDPNGTISVRNFDALNRLVDVIVTRAAGVAGTTAESYEYDGSGRIVRASDDNGSVATTHVTESVYDSLGRLIEERANGKVTSTIFSGDGKRVRTTYPGGRVIANAFDALDRVVQIQDVTTVVNPTVLATSHWIGSGYRELRRHNGNNTVLSFLDDAGDSDSGYDTVRQIRRLRVLAPGAGAIVDREYGHNRAGLRTVERRLDDGALADSYSYDSAYRIVSTALDQDGAGVQRDVRTLAYGYDGVGNRRMVGEISTSAGVRNVAYAVNQNNEYTSIGGGLRVFSPNGNLLDDGARTYTYDYKNRLMEVRNRVTGATVATYLYDSNDRRVAKIVGGAETRFLYDGWRVCEEQNSSSQTLVTYAYSPVYIDEPLQLSRTAAHPLGAGVAYLHQNARADVVAVTDGAGSVIERRTYDDFGQAVDAAKQPVVASSVGNPFGFQGARLDSETGLYYFRHRYYDPAAGHFLQRDPVWDPANAGAYYTFAANSPVSRRDPMGLQGEDCPPEDKGWFGTGGVFGHGMGKHKQHLAERVARGEEVTPEEWQEADVNQRRGAAGMEAAAKGAEVATTLTGSPGEAAAGLVTGEVVDRHTDPSAGPKPPPPPPIKPKSSPGDAPPPETAPAGEGESDPPADAPPPNVRPRTQRDTTRDRVRRPQLPRGPARCQANTERVMDEEGDRKLQQQSDEERLQRYLKARGITREEYDREKENSGMRRKVIDQRTGRELP